MLADAFAEGARNLPGSESSTSGCCAVAGARAFGTEPHRRELSVLRDAKASQPLSFLTPAQSTCNYVTLFLRNIASALSERLDTGMALRFNLVTIDDVPGAESVAPQKLYTTPARAR